jgi:flagella basal body P-ring formation protein FlgA
VRLPVLANGAARDALISESDIVWLETAGVNASLYVQNVDELIGMSARRDLKPGQPLRATDVAAPIAFKRGDIITMIIEAPGMRLSHRAIAMETGAIGDLVDVKNAASERIVKGIVVDRNVVRIPGPADMRAQQYSLLKD